MLDTHVLVRTLVERRTHRRPACAGL